MTISQLDLLLMGRRGINSRLSNLENAAKVLSGEATPTEEPTPVRPNLLTNSSFEFFDRGTTAPKDWTLGGGAVGTSGTVGADGANSLLLPSGSSASQVVAGGTSLPLCSVVISIFALAAADSQSISLSLAHTPGVDASAIMRIDAAGTVEETAEVPNDGLWYRFYRSYLLAGGANATVTFAPASGSALEVDAAKVEKEDDVSTWLPPTAYSPDDWGSATHIRNLAADNIVTGTLIVGGSLSGNPRISVLNGSDVEIVTIGDPVGGFLGIDIKGAAGLQISGTGSAEITGGGNLEVSGGGSISVTGGNVNITDGALNVSGTGGINVNGGGSVTVGNGGDVTVEGTGVVRAGNPLSYHAELAAGGLSLYDAAAEETILLSALTGKVHIFKDPLQMENGGKLSYVSGLVWADNKGFWMIDGSGNAAFGISGADSQSWGGLTLDKGDVLIGLSTKYIKWDASAGTLTIQGDGSGITSIDGGNIQTGTITAAKLTVSQLSAIAADLGSITAGTITGATIQTATSGARVVLSAATAGGIVGYGASDTYNVATGSGTYQVLWQKSDGVLYAGSGVVKIDASGVSLVQPVDAPSNTATFKFVVGSTKVSGISSYNNSTDHFITMQADVVAGKAATAGIAANSPNTYASTAVLSGQSSNTYAALIVTTTSTDTAGGGSCIAYFRSGLPDQTKMKVGINTASPGTALHVVGADDANNGQVKVVALTNIAGVSLWTAGGSTYRNWLIAANGSAAGNLSIFRSTTNTGNPTTSVVEINSSGHVGVGTSTPGGLGDGGSPRTLQVHGPSGYGHLALTSDVTSASSLGALVFASTGISGTEKRVGAIFGVKDDTSTTTAAGHLEFYTTSAGTIAERVRITAAGRVGIGTVAPSRTLTIDNGTHVYLGFSKSGTAKMAVGWEDVGSGRLSVYDEVNGRYIIQVPSSAASNANYATFAGTSANNAIVIQTTYSGGSKYHAGLVWNTYENNDGIPKAGIYPYMDGNGSTLLFWTSDNYGVGLTQNIQLLKDGSLIPGTTGTQNLGTAAQYWNDVSYKTLTDRGCLAFIDQWEMPDGRRLSATEAFEELRPHPTEKTIYGEVKLDYSWVPKHSHKPAPIAAEDIYEPDLTDLDENDQPKHKRKHRKGDKMGADGVEMTALLSMQMGVIRDLIARVKKLEAKEK